MTLIVLLLYYGFLVLVVATVVALIFRSLRKRGRGTAWFASSLALALALMFFPILGHGTFTFPVEILIQELRSGGERVEQKGESEKKAAFRRKLRARFAGPLAFPVGHDTADRFYSIRTAAGERGWYDEGSGLVWTDMLPLESTGAPPDLAQAKAFCGQIEPKGFWALPTEAELFLFWKAGGYGLSPLGDYGTAALLENVDFQTELLTVRVSKTFSYALRCVALAPGASPGGYLSGDIPIDEWNAYQLRKSMPGSPGPETR